MSATELPGSPLISESVATQARSRERETTRVPLLPYAQQLLAHTPADPWSALQHLAQAFERARANGSGGSCLEHGQVLRRDSDQVCQRSGFSLDRKSTRLNS